MKHHFHCDICGKDKTHEDNLTTGYGTDRKTGQVVCFDCCGQQDAETLRTTGTLHGYFSKGKDGQWYFTNWPGTFKLAARHIRHSWHNFAGKDGRTDFNVTFEGVEYYGKQIGHWNQCATIKRYKSQ